MIHPVIIADCFKHTINELKFLTYNVYRISLLQYSNGNK